ncbi:MAG: thioredoxin family protein [Actinomycetota bacterium]|nr:thioredoxin family protein [Actinomycetota bacterium]
MIVEMLHTEGCPHAVRYLPRLRRLAVDAGVGDPVRVRVIADDDTARRERFLGSPTVRVDGRDVDPGAGARRDYGLSCRLYAGQGGPSGAPPDEWVLATIHGWHTEERAADTHRGGAG